MSLNKLKTIAVKVSVTSRHNKGKIIGALMSYEGIKRSIPSNIFFYNKCFRRVSVALQLNLMTTNITASC